MAQHPLAMNDFASAEVNEDTERVPPDKLNVSGITTIRPTISAIHANHGSKAELDSHADTCSFGRNAYLVRDTGETVSVGGFIDSLGTVIRVPVVTAAVAYDDPTTSDKRGLNYLFTRDGALIPIGKGANVWCAPQGWTCPFINTCEGCLPVWRTLLFGGFNLNLSRNII